MIRDTQDVIRKAMDDEINPAIVALQHGFQVSSPELWWHPIVEDDIDDVYVENIDLMAGYNDIVSQFSSALAKDIQFPASSIFLHALGTISACMVEKFTYTLGSRSGNAVGLYTVSTQPPSTGKSGVNKNLSGPARDAYNEINVKNEPGRRKLLRRITKLKKVIEKAPANEADAMEVDILDLEKQLAEIPVYAFAETDATPEGCEKRLIQHGGFFNILSAESAAVKVVLGTVYGDRATNNGVFLSAWDNEYISVARGGRDGYSGHARAAIAILAQDESISEILRAGLGGEGISERFLILRERSMLGFRDKTQSCPVDAAVRREYETLIKNIINTRYSVDLVFSKAAENLVRDAGDDFEPKMRSNGKYGSNMMRGVVGKNEKQICRIASVLHVIDNWMDGGSKSNQVQKDHVIRAGIIFSQLLQTYVAAADSKGFSGNTTELNLIIDNLRKLAGKNKLKTDVRQLRDRIKNTQPFSSMQGLQKKLKNDYLPDLQKQCYVVFDDESGEIYINPRLKS